MNRRSFIKRIAAVAAGAVAVPTIAKQLPFKPNPIQHIVLCNDKYRWVQVYGPYCSGEINAAPVDYLNTVSGVPLHELGTMAYTGDGRQYRYMKNCTTEQLIAGAHYANCGKCKRTDLHDHTRCTG